MPKLGNLLDAAVSPRPTAVPLSELKPPPPEDDEAPLTEEQAAELLLLRDPLCCDCANRLGALRDVTDRERNLADDGSQRAKQLRNLEAQLERALHNQRRYVLGRCGLGHMADGLAHLEGLGAYVLRSTRQSRTQHWGVTT
jgi:hypothetical protein